MLKFILLRMIVPAFFGILGWNMINQYPPMSWIDPDRREISRLNKELAGCKESKEQLIRDKNILENGITEQNQAIEKLNSEAVKKQKELNRLSDTLGSQLNNLKSDLKSKELDIKTCQDAIDYLVGGESD